MTKAQVRDFARSILKHRAELQFIIDEEQARINEFPDKVKSEFEFVSKSFYNKGGSDKLGELLSIFEEYAKKDSEQKGGFKA